MSIISIALLNDSASMEVIKVIRSVFGDPLTTIVNTIKEGRPVYEQEIFDNAFNEKYEKLNKFLVEIEKLGVRVRISEDGYPISSEILKNILTSAKEIQDEIE